MNLAEPYQPDPNPNAYNYVGNGVFSEQYQANVQHLECQMTDIP